MTKPTVADVLRELHDHGAHYNGASAWQRSGPSCALDCVIPAAIAQSEAADAVIAAAADNMNELADYLDDKRMSEDSYAAQVLRVVVRNEFNEIRAALDRLAAAGGE